MNKFREFLDKKGREAKKQLSIVKRMLVLKGMDATDHLNDEDPYVFLKAKNKNLSFDGIRIYKIGDALAYRIQREEDTHPYGTSYPLDIEAMYDDLLSDGKKEKEAGEIIIDHLPKELKKFFDKSQKSEEETSSSDIDKPKDPLDKTVAKSSVSDYSNTIK